MSTQSLPTFRAHPMLAGGHRQTIAAYYLPGVREWNPDRVHEVEVSDGDRVAVLANHSTRRSPLAKVVVLMHGLGGDAGSPYMLRIGALFAARGWHVYRMNHRGCGHGAGLAKQTYHSGRSEDVSAVLNAIAQRHPNTHLISIGFSLSGNALLKLLGEGRHPIPESLSGALAITPPIDLSACADALTAPRNKIYDFRFVVLLREAVAQRQRHFTDFPKFDFPWSMNLRDFDEICTAPLNGFADAEDYYRKCSARQFLTGISIPALILAADDDPFIPASAFEKLSLPSNVELMLTRSGGHMGFISADKSPLGNRRWMDYAILVQAESCISGSRMRAKSHES